MMEMFWSIATNIIAISAAVGVMIFTALSLKPHFVKEKLDDVGAEDGTQTNFSFDAIENLIDMKPVVKTPETQTAEVSKSEPEVDEFVDDIDDIDGMNNLDDLDGDAMNLDDIDDFGESDLSGLDDFDNPFDSESSDDTMEVDDLNLGDIDSDDLDMDMDDLDMDDMSVDTSEGNTLDIDSEISEDFEVDDLFDESDLEGVGAVDEAKEKIPENRLTKLKKKMSDENELEDAARKEKQDAEEQAKKEKQEAEMQARADARKSGNPQPEIDMEEATSTDLDESEIDNLLDGLDLD
jgi:hypothetical protein